MRQIGNYKTLKTIDKKKKKKQLGLPPNKVGPRKFSYRDIKMLFTVIWKTTWQ